MNVKARTSSWPWLGAMNNGCSSPTTPSTLARRYAPSLPNISALTVMERLLPAADWIAPERPGTALQPASCPVTGGPSGGTTMVTSPIGVGADAVSGLEVTDTVSSGASMADEHAT